jgi:hypothetical protein
VGGLNPPFSLVSCKQIPNCSDYLGIYKVWVQIFSFITTIPTIKILPDMDIYFWKKVDRYKVLGV